MFLGISNFLEEISSLFILLFSSISLHWSLRKAFLSPLAILWNSAFTWEYLSFSPLLFTSLRLTAIFKASSDNHFAFLHFLLLGHKKECIWVCSDEVDDPRTKAERGKSEREKQLSYINVCIWNVERWYWWSYLWGSSGDTDMESRLVDTVGEGEGGTNWDSRMETSALPYVK